MKTDVHLMIDVKIRNSITCFLYILLRCQKDVQFKRKTKMLNKPFKKYFEVIKPFEHAGRKKKSNTISVKRFLKTKAKSGNILVNGKLIL